ncbi:PREDICTED: RWD domain-containing protein 2A [Rhagoletis zephyria]|uniref:RWD domain-containing protein 2A n=1 Tax=Rhagoletis zephyria TaxID=28612 RepID=UPI000811A73C|nr:PREDICTED: RWD domain-containing protein 2A [Rhagoletis zephyria]XP_017476787.1 PREDICTED: RWD domain-containing protein 2A [Rhagoletis zephyria]XP_036333635.1 RWD domain-containing protein 2A [Rhagoletis pomonella]XP_036333636.1 RWD domain-containing protein 2A [Rhagoletis pomonella]XP_036333637.1 RWD domain-containing protein 2A [Rhagoletis pomonella]
MTDTQQQAPQHEQLDEQDLYVQCISKQLEEVDMLSSIYCTPGEMHIFDASVIGDFNDFLNMPTAVPTIALKAHLDYTITLTVAHGQRKDKMDIRIELPHLYPLLENAIVTVFSALLGKTKELYLKREIEKYIETMDKTECYVFQVVSWLQDELIALIARDASEFEENDGLVEENENEIECERLWIYSHHIKSKKKRQEIQREARNLDLTGFSRPGKPGIICVEGLREHTQDFWRIIKAMRWQHITICKSEPWQGKLQKRRRFEGFKEQLFCDNLDNEDGVMNMGLFIKFLETHKSGYMKKELFGLD